MQRVSHQGVPLPFEQNLMLWSMRIWVIGLYHDIGAPARIHDALERVGAADAASSLDGFMVALSQGAKRRIAIHCVCHPHVEPDERALLDVLSLAQESRTLEALLLLRGIVHDTEAAAVLRSAQGLGTELALADHFLQAPGGAASPFETPGESITALRPCSPQCAPMSCPSSRSAARSVR